MARSSQQVWEVRTTGSDTNGGGFKAGASGTDYSTQAAAQIAVADGVANGTTTITSATAGFTAAHVGNLVYVSGGTGSITADRYEVISVTNSTTIVVDRSTGLTTGTGVTLNLGGAIATLAELSNSTRGMTAGNKAFLRADGNYTPGATVTFAQTVSPSQTNPPSRLVGYATTRGDGGQAQINPSFGTGPGLSFTGAGWVVENLSINGNAMTGGSTAVLAMSNSNSVLMNCRVTNFGIYGITGSSGGVVFKCEVSGGAAGCQRAIDCSTGAMAVVGCYVHDNPCPGIVSASSGSVFTRNLIANNSGATSDGINCIFGCHVSNNTIYKSGRHGIFCNNSNFIGDTYLNNILSENGGYGINAGSAAGRPANPLFDGNAFYSNTSGTINNGSDTSTVPQNGVGAYTFANNVTLTADPFTAKASNDFTLNNTAGGGAACRGAGVPRSWPGLAIAGYPDFGAVQHQDAGGASGGIMSQRDWLGGLM